MEHKSFSTIQRRKHNREHNICTHPERHNFGGPLEIQYCVKFTLATFSLYPVSCTLHISDSVRENSPPQPKPHP